MPRPVTLFTGQWADLPFETLCQKAKAFGYDGVELACWGDHFEVDKARNDEAYVRRALGHLEQARPEGAAPSATTSSARPCATTLTSATSSILPPRLWGDGIRRRRARSAPPRR